MTDVRSGVDASSLGEPGDDRPDGDERVAQLQKRYDRERKARLEAESIAESGMRALYDANVDLDRRIAERTEELEQARATAEAASLIKSDLLQGLSHEMRTPMNGILGMLELLSDEVTSAQHRLWIDTATTAAKGLNRTLARLVEAMALDEAAAQAADVEVEQVLQQTANHWGPGFLKSAKLLTTDFDLPAGLTIRTANRAFGRALDELLLNAMHHGDPGAVRYTAALETGGAVCDRCLVVGVEDAGPGLSNDRRQDLMSPIFERRTRTTSTAEGGGLQLGLLLVARASFALGGSWGLEAAGSGTRAWLRIPLR